MNASRHPFASDTLVLGLLSVPLAFARHLVSLALVMAVVAIALYGWGRWRTRGRSVAPASSKRARTGFLAALAGLVCSIVMWVLWASNWLLQH